MLVNGDPNPKRPDLPHYGAGETMRKPLIAAVANAIYDATGVRLRRVPFRERARAGGAERGENQAARAPSRRAHAPDGGPREPM